MTIIVGSTVITAPAHALHVDWQHVLFKGNWQFVGCLKWRKVRKSLDHRSVPETTHRTHVRMHAHKDIFMYVHIIRSACLAHGDNHHTVRCLPSATPGGLIPINRGHPLQHYNLKTTPRVKHPSNEESPSADCVSQCYWIWKNYPKIIWIQRTPNPYFNPFLFTRSSLATRVCSLASGHWGWKGVWHVMTHSQQVWEVTYWLMLTDGGLNIHHCSVGRGLTSSSSIPVNLLGHVCYKQLL